MGLSRDFKVCLASVFVLFLCAYALNATAKDTRILNADVFRMDGNGAFHSDLHTGTLSGNLTFTWPGTYGTLGYVLTTDGAGSLSWVAAGVPTGLFVATQGSPGTGGGYAFQETGNDTGFWSPTDGLINVYANNTVVSKFTATGISEIRGVTYAWPSGQGAASTVLTNNGSGTLSWSPVSWATPGAIGSTTPSTGAFTSLASNFLHVTMTPDYTTGGVLGDSDTGFVFPSDGVISVYANSVIAAQFQTVGISQIRGVNYSWPASQAAANNYVLTNDGNGALSWAPPVGTPTGAARAIASFNESTGDLQATPNFSFDENIGYGLQHNGTVVPTTSFNMHNFANAFNPAADQVGINANHYNLSLGLGNDDAGFSIDADNSGQITQLAAGIDGAHKLNWGTVRNIAASANFGNGTDAQTGVHYEGVEISATANNAATITDVFMLPMSFQGASGSAVTNFHGIYDSSSFAGALNSYDGVDIGNGNQAHISNNVFGFTFGGNWTLVDQGFTGYYLQAGGGTVTGYYSSFRGGGGWTNLGTGGSGFEDTLSVTGTQSNQYTSFNAHPNIAESHGITGLDWEPTVTVLTGASANGLNLRPSITATGSENIYLINCDMTNVVVNTGQKKCIHGSGDIDMDGQVNASRSVAISDTGGSPPPIQSLGASFTAGDGVTIANAENFAFSPLTNVTVGDGSHLSSGGLGAGINSEGFISLINIGTGSEIGDIGGSFAVGVLIGGSGTVHHVHGFRVALVNGGGTETVGDVKAFEYPITGGSATAGTEWGAYIAPTWTQNYMGGHLKVGGSDTTTARAEFDAGSGIGVVVDSTLSADPFEIKTGGVAKWYIDSSLNTWAYGHILADEGGSGAAAGPVYSFNGSTSSGMYLLSGPRLGFSTAGTERVQMGPAGLGIVTTGAKPTCNSAARGYLFTEQGGAGVADKTYQCLKDSLDAYSWVQVVSAA